MNKQLIKSIFQDDPEIQALLAAQDKRELDKRLEKILPLKDGHTPTEEELLALIEPLIPEPIAGKDGYTPIKNIDYFDGAPGADGHTPTKSELVKIIKPLILDPIPGSPGRDGIDGKNFDIKALDKYLESFELRLGSVEKSNTINPKGKIDQRWHGAGLSKVSTDATLTGNGTPSSPLSVVSSGGSLTFLPTTGTIDDSNTTFIFTTLPKVLIINGGMYQQTGGSITWTWNAGILTATLSSPVGVGGSIFGLS